MRARAVAWVRVTRHDDLVLVEVALPRFVWLALVSLVAVASPAATVFLAG